MKQYVCGVCGYIYDEAEDGPWEDLPEDWKCPWCGAGKDAFREKSDAPAQAQDEEKTSSPEIPDARPHIKTELSPMEMSVICSNLARGCEKQYLAEQSEQFRILADFFRGEAEPASDTGTDKLLELIDRDLSASYPYGHAVSAEGGDRGAMRCQVWSEKVTRMLQSLLTRYREEGDRMLENTGVYVCSVCGFVYLGDSAPELCPVCKVPAWKFDRAERRA